MMDIRPANARGHADHGWLESYHTFAFADYVDPDHVEFGALRVINEDRVQPGAGFGTHGHRNMEIISYVIAGELAHKDSMGNGSVIRPGDVQRMSAGRGVQHSEFNPSSTQIVHFLQIWIRPNVAGIAPSYEQKRFEPAEKRGRLRCIASPDGMDGSVSLHQDAKLYAGMFDANEQANLAIDPGRLAYVHMVAGTIRANGLQLTAGDGMKLRDVALLELREGQGAELLVFDLPGVPAR